MAAAHARSRPYALSLALHLALSAGLALCACAPEKRDVGPAPPVTPPLSEQDQRIPLYQENKWQISQGGRFFTWYGCQSCHTEHAKGALDLTDDQWKNGGGFTAVWASIAAGRTDGMPGYAGRVPDEQIWQLTAYVRDEHRHARPLLRREDSDETNEPQSSTASVASAPQPKAAS